MKKGFCLIVAIGLACAGVLACGEDSTTQQQPTATEPASTVESTSAATTEPTTTPTAMPEPTPEPTAAPTVTPPPSPTATAVPEPTSTVDSGIQLSDDCLPGGVLDDAATILSCAVQAIQQVESFSFQGSVDLLALFPVDGAGPGEGAMRMSGAIVAPDKLQFTISMQADEEKIEINAVMIGREAFVQDPESGQWFKGVPPDADFLGSIQMVGMLQIPNDPNADLEEIIELDDGTRGYVIVSDQTGPGGGMSGLGLPGGNLTWVVGVDDFLTREVRVPVEGLSDEPLDIISMSYSGYNEEYEIASPAEYTALPDE